jgi:hypothetical protein
VIWAKIPPVVKTKSMSKKIASPKWLEMEYAEFAHSRANSAIATFFVKPCPGIAGPIADD